MHDKIRQGVLRSSPWASRCIMNESNKYQIKTRTSRLGGFAEQDEIEISGYDLFMILGTNQAKKMHFKKKTTTGTNTIWRLWPLAPTPRSKKRNIQNPKYWHSIDYEYTKEDNGRILTGWINGRHFKIRVTKFTIWLEVPSMPRRQTSHRRHSRRGSHRITYRISLYMKTGN